MAITKSNVSRECEPSYDGVRYAAYPAGDKPLPGGGGGGGGGDPVYSWQLDAGHYVPRKFDMTIVHPRPTAETHAGEQHRNAYTGLAWSTRVLVYGGSYPFKFELVTGPSGMTIGETMVQSGDVQVEPSNYGKLEWSNPTAGDHTVTVRVYDQEYLRGDNQSTPAEVTFTLTVGTSNWVFIDPVNGSNANAGTLAAPFADTTPFVSGSTYAGKCVYLRTGTMDLVGMSGSHYTFTGSQPGTFVGYPGDSPVIRFSSGHFVCTSAGFCIKDVELRHNTTPYQAAGQKMLVWNAGAHRSILTDCDITRFDIAASNSSNPAVISSTPASTLNYPCMAYNNFSGLQGTAWQSFRCNKGVIHCNVWSNVTSWQFDASNAGVVYFKDSTYGASLRANQCWYNNVALGSQNLFALGGQNQAGAPYGCANLEFCWNTFWKVATATNDSALREYVNVRGAGDLDNFHAYRNSFGAEDNIALSDAVATNCTRQNNVLHGGAAMDSAPGFSDSNNLQSGNYLDASMKLTGSARTTYLGTRGAEIA